jgi:hypothetical protein
VHSVLYVTEPTVQFLMDAPDRAHCAAVEDIEGEPDNAHCEATFLTEPTVQLLYLINLTDFTATADRRLST